MTRTLLKAWEAAAEPAFGEGREFTEADLISAAAQLVPLSRTAREQLEALQQWASGGRARPASLAGSAADAVDCAP